MTIQHCMFYALAGRIAFIWCLKIDYIQLFLFSRIMLQDYKTLCDFYSDHKDFSSYFHISKSSAISFL